MQKIETFNVRTLNTINQLPKLTASAAEHNIAIIYMQEHRYYHSELDLKYHYTGNGWIFVLSSSSKNSFNFTIGCVGMLLSPCMLKSQDNIVTRRDLALI